MSLFGKIFDIYNRINYLIESMAAIYSRCKNKKEGILYMLGLKNKVSLKFIDGSELFFEKKDKSLFNTLLNLMWRHGISFSGSGISWEVDLKKGIIKTHQGIILDIRTLDLIIIPETFIYDIHFLGFDLEDKIIIDIGAYIGDTALYYANLGGIVYAYEPNPFNFYFLRRNLELNPSLAKRIRAYNYAVGEDGEIEIGYEPFISGGFSALYSKGRVKARVRSVSLKTIIEENSIKDPYLLKADCKGCEEYLIKQKEIALFKYVKIEYTTIGPDLIINELRKKGFNKFRIYKPNYLLLSFLKNYGTIVASK